MALSSSSEAIGSLMASLSRVCRNDACARAFDVPARYVARGEGLYCSRSCASIVKARQWHAAHPHAQAGSNNHNFKGWASLNKRVYVDRFRAKYPEKARAHDAVKNALATGVLVKPETCGRCGEKRPLAAHHENYARPLVVVWTCRDCHRNLDRLRRDAEPARKAS